MRRTEMSPEQLQERDLMVSELAGAGWESSEHQKRFDDGMWTYFEAAMEYHHEPVRLTLRYRAESRAVLFSFQESGGKGGVSLRISCPDKLKQLIHTINEFRDTISSSNYKEHVSSIVRLCPETYAAVGPEGDSMVRLVESGSHEES